MDGEKELGVIVANDLKCGKHLDRMVGKENRILGMLKSAIKRKDPKL